MFKKLKVLTNGLKAKKNIKKAVGQIDDAKEATKEDLISVCMSKAECLKKGNITEDPKSMKVRSLIVMYVSLALLSIKGATNAFGIELPIPDAAIEHFAELIGTIVMSYLLYSHVASTDKIDLFGRTNDRDSGNEREDN